MQAFVCGDQFGADVVGKGGFWVGLDLPIALDQLAQGFGGDFKGPGRLIDPHRCAGKVLGQQPNLMYAHDRDGDPVDLGDRRP